MIQSAFTSTPPNLHLRTMSAPTLTSSQIQIKRTPSVQRTSKRRHDEVLSGLGVRRELYATTNGDKKP